MRVVALVAIVLCLISAVSVSARRARGARSNKAHHARVLTTNSEPDCDGSGYPTPTPSGGLFTLSDRSGSLHKDTCTAQYSACDGNSGEGFWNLPSDPNHAGGYYWAGPNYLAFEFEITGPETMYFSTCPVCPGSPAAASAVPAPNGTEVWFESVTDTDVNPWDPQNVGGDDWCARTPDPNASGTPDSTPYCFLSHYADGGFVDDVANRCDYGIGAQSVDLPKAGKYRMFIAYQERAYDCMNNCQSCNEVDSIPEFDCQDQDPPTSWTDQDGIQLCCNPATTPYCGPISLSYSLDGLSAMRAQAGCAVSPNPPSSSDAVMAEECQGSQAPFCQARHSEL